MIEKSPLGQKTAYVETYTPSLLFPIPRKLGRDKIGLLDKVPFHGEDIWTAYELSWLNKKGKPEIAIGEFIFPSLSPYIVESKSFKLYLNSFNQSSFSSFEEVQKIIENDLSKASGSAIKVCLYLPKNVTLQDFKGICLDELPIETKCYEVNPDLLFTEDQIVEETVYSNLLKSNCLATLQPDWGSILISYRGSKIDHAALLKYIISYRRHCGFHEHCIEQIFCDVLKKCQPEKLTVYGRYTRRGGLDINPFRSNFEEAPKNLRAIRQ